MRVPQIPAKPEQHIDTSTAGFMTATSLFFDALDLAPAGIMTAATGAAVAVGWFPFLGQLVGMAALGAGFVISWAVSVVIAVVAFLTFFTWFQIKGVSLGLGDRFAIKRALIWAICFLLESLPIPFMSALPMLTVSVVASILISWGQDREARLKWENKLSRLEGLFWQISRMDINGIHPALRSILHASKGDRVTHARLKSKLRALEMRQQTRELAYANDNAPRKLDGERIAA